MGPGFEVMAHFFFFFFFALDGHMLHVRLSCCRVRGYDQNQTYCIGVPRYPVISKIKRRYSLHIALLGSCSQSGSKNI